MPCIDMIISAPHLLSMEGEGVGYLEKQALAIDGGKIIARGDIKSISDEYKSHRYINAEHHLIMPGLIDAHIHSSECSLRGLAQDTNSWMMDGLEPFLEQLDDAARPLGTELALLEAIKSGTTTFGEFTRNPELLIPTFTKAGVRLQLTTTIREAVDRIYSPGELYEYDQCQGQKTYEHALDIFHKYNDSNHGKINVLLGPQAADFVGLKLLLQTFNKAKELGCKIHMHTQQGDRETAQVMQRYGQRPIPWLDQHNLLTPELIAVHLTDANRSEAELVASRGSSMILCSGSIGIIDGIVPPAKYFADSGGAVALGSDQAPGNNNHNIFNEMKLTALFNKIKFQDPEALPAWQALRMATIDGAKAIGLDHKIGSLSVGKQADLIVIDLNKPNIAPIYTNPMRNIVPNLVYAARGDEVVISMVAGKIIYENGTVLGLDESNIIKKVNIFACELGNKARPQFQSTNGTNAHFMKEGKL